MFFGLRACSHHANQDPGGTVGQRKSSDPEALRATLPFGTFRSAHHNLRSLLHTRVWCIPEFGAENKKCPFQDFSPSFCSFEGSRAIPKPAPNPGTHQTRVETLSDNLITGELVCEIIVHLI